MEKKVIFWDFDGTLVKSNRSFLCSLQQAAADQGAELGENSMNDFLKTACSWYHPQDSYPEMTGEKWWESLLGKTDTYLKGQAVEESKIESILGGFRQNAVHYDYVLYEDAKRILQLAKEKGYRNYILSNNFPELQERVMQLGLESYVEGCFLSSEIGYEKPRKEIFSYALAKTGNPSLCFMVGDNPVADIRGAGAVGMKTILVHGKKPDAGADWNLCSLIEIAGVI